VLAVLVLLTGCGGASPAASAFGDPMAACARVDSAGVVQLTADNIAFDAPCIVAPADTAFTIRLVNVEAVQHDVAIYEDSSLAAELFRGDLITGPDATIDYAIEPMAAGEYWFNCFVHPADMSGILYVE